MTPDEIRSIANDLESNTEWAQRETVETYVCISDDTYPVDLGAFGEQYLAIEQEDYHYSIAAEGIFDAAPYDISDIETMVSALRAHADEEEEKEPTPASLADVLSEMAESEDEDEQALANTLGLVYALYQRMKEARTTFAPPGSVGSPPSGPQPWPGALRSEIDYTASDFPLLYDPPPGFKWAKMNSSFTLDDPVDAERVGAEERAMMLDNLGRVAWDDKADADLSGDRWSVWNESRDEIPCARGFNSGTPPRAIDVDGTIIPEAHTSGTAFCESTYNWHPGDQSEAFAAVARRRGATTPEIVSTSEETSNEFAPPAAVSV